MAEPTFDLIESKTKLTVGPIQRHPVVSNTQLGFLAAALLVWVPFPVKRILAGDTLLLDSKLWFAFVVFVYFFSVSGAMHNIIRKMPTVLVDRNGPSKIVFFYPGSGMQLGAGGGGVLAFVTHLLVLVRNSAVQRGFMLISRLVCFWAVKKVVYLDNWKTGCSIHG